MKDLTSMWYEVDDQQQIRLYCSRKGEVEVVPSPFKPYMFVEVGKEPIIEYMAKRLRIPVEFESTKYVTVNGSPVTKVITDIPSQIGVLHRVSKVPVLEADIPFERRVRLDLGWQTGTDYRTAYFDTEQAVESKGKVGKGQTIAIVLYNESKIDLISGESEEDLYKEFMTKVSNYDLLVGYNSDNYDIPVMEQQLRRYGFKGLPRTLRVCDMYWMLKASVRQQLPSWTLDYVTKHLIGERRVHVDKPFKELTSGEIEERCIRDSELLYLLEKKLALVEVAVQKANISSIFPDETSSITRCIDSLLLTEARRLGYVLPCREYSETRKHSGALVLEPPEAIRIYDGVLVLDVTSMYPSIILQFKLSPDPNHEIYPNVVNMLLQERLKWKKIASSTKDPKADAKQYSLKIFLNAIYGCMSTNSRLKSYELGDQVATHGREVIKLLAEGCMDLGLEVLYGDTDSVFVRVGKMDEQLFEEIANYLENLVTQNLGIKLSIEAAEYFDRLFFPRRAVGNGEASKKRYYGRVVWEKGGKITPYLKAVGVELVRSDYPQCLKTLQQRLVERYLDGASMQEIYALARGFRAQIASGKIGYEDLAFSKAITKTDYKAFPHHVQAAKKLLTEQGIKVDVGEKVRYIYTRHGVEPLPIRNMDSTIDVDYYYQMASAMIQRTFGIVLSDTKPLDLYI